MADENRFWHKGDTENRFDLIRDSTRKCDQFGGGAASPVYDRQRVVPGNTDRTFPEAPVESRPFDQPGRTRYRLIRPPKSDAYRMREPSQLHVGWQCALCVCHEVR